VTDSNTTGENLDLEIALSHVGGDLDLLSELASLFLQDYPRLLAEMQDAIRQGSDSDLERAAHTLKGRLAFFGVLKVRDQALALEMMGRTHNSVQAASAFAEIESEMACILPEFAALVN
jgi:two-component system sensor histidine kinase/response regulator